MSIEPDEILKDAQLEQRAREISSVLRCMVCQNENIDNSNAGIARDLRILIREELVAGKTNSQIIDFVHNKYGDYVLFKPPLKFYTFFFCQRRANNHNNKFSGSEEQQQRSLAAQIRNRRKEEK